MTIATREPKFFAPLVHCALLQCMVCHRPFDFAFGETAVVLRHVAYGHDFVHDGACLDTAREWMFLEPGYDTSAFSPDPLRVKVLQVWAADGWSAVLPEAPQHVMTGGLVRFEPLQCWVLVEHSDGSWHKEGILRDPEWTDEPGGAEFPEAWRSGDACIDYVAEDDRADPVRRARWAARVMSRYAAYQRVSPARG
jgi:hypothetical protein